MAKQLLFKDEARRKILSGVEQLSAAVKVTFGLRAAMLSWIRNSVPHYYKDGVT